MTDKKKEEEKDSFNLCGARKNCKNAKTKPHTCPYQEEICDNKEFECTCCDDCRQECVWDI